MLSNDLNLNEVVDIRKIRLEKRLKSFQERSNEKPILKQDDIIAKLKLQREKAKNETESEKLERLQNHKRVFDHVTQRWFKKTKPNDSLEEFQNKIDFARNVFLRAGSLDDAIKIIAKKASQLSDSVSTKTSKL